jgi:L-alanine-DL-glutamate epimerase-like enolase superfamily enzyme
LTPYEKLAALPLTIDSYDVVGSSLEVSSDFTRRTTLVHLRGEGTEGIGEDVTYDPGDQQAFRETEIAWPLTGRFRLSEFSARVGELDLFPRPPRSPSNRFYRRWAFESAGLDLALRQSHRSLADYLGLRARPVRFVVSTSLGRPPSAQLLRDWRKFYPGLRFKLDATSAWDDALISELVRTGAVESVDFKGAYRGTVVDQPADAELYRRVARAFPEAWLEDPNLTPITAAALADQIDRVTWDAPIHGVRDIESLTHEPRMLNIKPSRFGSLRTLFEVYDYCIDREIGMYGGGQFELGAGRGQIQLLASLFHADAPNDVAPGGYNVLPPRAGLPDSPLVPQPDSIGFRWG